MDGKARCDSAHHVRDWRRWADSMATRPRGNLQNQARRIGEVTRYKCRAQEGSIGNSQFKWGIGVWLGIDGRTGQHILFDASQGGIQYARTLMRMPDAQKFDLDKIASVTATPWSIHETAQQEGVFAEKEVKPQQEQAGSVSKTKCRSRKQTLTRTDTRQAARNVL